ncbi:hypothetical protein ACIQU1_00430 [Streptomyces angustmyceticus]|uniref:hypothetical protein n=1 Tax=Streptomyces angustmyceticus TaxID=285578 RepID=UPI0037F81BB3
MAYAWAWKEAGPVGRAKYSDTVSDANGATLTSAASLYTSPPAGIRTPSAPPKVSRRTVPARSAASWSVRAIVAPATSSGAVP